MKVRTHALSPVVASKDGSGFASVLAAALLFALAYAGSAAADVGAQHRAVLPRPIDLGVSGGSAAALDGAFCCGGTLGGVVRDCGGTLYLLSNNHVLGRTNRATPGEDVVQPGLIDSGCRSSAANVVADFTEYVPLDFVNDNVVDAAIAQIRSGKVSTSGDQLDIGTVSATVAVPDLGMSVQKDGRTTGHTTGTVIDTDVTVIVGYPKKCGGGSGPGAVMTDQFRISDADFSNSGDSGSVIYTTGSNPRPVGLLFAGGATSTIANKIANVLSADWGVGPLAMAGGTPQGCSGGCASDADCGDGDACTVDTCQAGSCSHAPVDCNDGNACTADSCSGGSCSNTVIDCNDGDACTTDSCNSGAGCMNDPISGCANPCGDGVCDLANEDCGSCPDDCNGTTRGKKSDRYCCGLDTDCNDSRCTAGNSCSGTLAGNSPSGPPGLALARARAAAASRSKALLAIEDVVGHGIGIDADGEPVIDVFMGRRNARSRALIPSYIDGVPVRIEVTGRFVAY